MAGVGAASASSISVLPAEAAAAGLLVAICTGRDKSQPGPQS